MKNLFIILLSYLGYTSPLFGMWAAGGVEPTFGIELTFTNGYLIKKGKTEGINHDGSRANKKARDLWAKEIRNLCTLRDGYERCEVSSSERRKYMIYTVTYPDGWYYNITVDPLVVEITAKPMTLNEVQHYQYRIQRDIFSFAAENLRVGPWYGKKTGLHPSPTVGGGHIHVGFESTFAQHPNPKLFLRNFLVDFSNHPTLAYSSLNRTKNNPPIALLKPRQIYNFEKILNRFDGYRNTQEFVKDIQKNVYYDTYRHADEKEPEAWLPPEKYQAINLTRLVNGEYDKKQRTIEIRSLRPQRSAQDLLRVITLFQARLQYIARISEEIPFNYSLASRSRLSHQTLEELKSYVQGAGLDFQFYKDFSRKDKPMSQFPFRRYQDLYL